MILTPEGRIVKNELSSYDPQYFISDYLGNNRVVFHANFKTGSVELIQEDHFDPFGMKLGGLGFVADIENKYLYQGKELNNDGIDTDNDNAPNIYLNWYDFEARSLDPQIGRWHVIDPVNQTSSPYIIMGNNPIRFIDPNGCVYTGYGTINDVWSRRIIGCGSGAHLGRVDDLVMKIENTPEEELYNVTFF